MPSSLNASMDATADAHASTWPEYVSPLANGLSFHPVGELSLGPTIAPSDVARVNPRDGEDGRDDVPVLAREPLAAATEARHHLVADQHDAVPRRPHGSTAGSRPAGRSDRSCRRSSRGSRRRRWRAFVPRTLPGAPARADGARVGVPCRTPIRVRVEQATTPGMPGSAASDAGHR